MDDKRLEVAHDHYKETFAYIREREKTRDRYFLVTILLFALLCLEVGYPAEFGASVRSLSVVGGEVDLAALPLPALLSVTWVLTLAVVLRYCSATVFVNRQYDYLHELEEQLCTQFDGDVIYHREGRRYLERYPPILDFIHLSYGLVFPCIVLVAVLSLLWVEWDRLPYPTPHRVFDTAVGGAVFLCFFLYQMQPFLVGQWNRLKSWKARSLSPEPVIGTSTQRTGSEG